MRTRFDLEKKSFVRLAGPAVKFESAEGTTNPDNRTPGRIVVLENADGSFDVIMSVSDGTAFRPAGPPGNREPTFFLACLTSQAMLSILCKTPPSA